MTTPIANEMSQNTELSREALGGPPRVLDLNIPAEQGAPPSSEDTTSLSKEDVENFKRVYKEIRPKWLEMNEILRTMHEDDFPKAEDYTQLTSLLLDFGGLVSEFWKEVQEQGAHLVHSSIGLLLLASADDFQSLLASLDKILQIFDQNKDLWTKVAQSVPPDPKARVKIEMVAKMAKMLDQLKTLLNTHKASIEAAPTDEKEEDRMGSPDKTVNIRPPTASVQAQVHLLVEAANRLDLRVPTQITKDQLAELLSYLKALRECYQAMHWVSRGEPYQGDHTLFSNLYGILSGEVDALAEKAIGYTDDAYVVEVQYQSARVAAHIAEIMSFLPDMGNIQCVLNAERKLVREVLPQLLTRLEQSGELSDGMENHLQGLADSHEKVLYHLQRRLKTQKDLQELGPQEPNISPPPAPTPNVNEEFDDMLDQETVE